MLKDDKVCGLVEDCFETGQASVELIRHTIERSRAMGRGEIPLEGHFWRDGQPMTQKDAMAHLLKMAEKQEAELEMALAGSTETIQ